MNRRKKIYKWCTSYNDGNDACGFHWNGGNDEWKNKQGKKSYVRYSNPATNAIIYWSYLMNTIEEESIEEEVKSDYDS